METKEEAATIGASTLQRITKGTSQSTIRRDGGRWWWLLGGGYRTATATATAAQFHSNSFFVVYEGDGSHFLDGYRR